MLLKVVALFLVFMMVMGAVQRLLTRNRGARPPAIDRLRCPRCKSIKVSVGPCLRCPPKGRK